MLMTIYFFLKYTNFNSNLFGLGLPGGSGSKASACKAGDLGFDPWIRKLP